MNEEWHLCSWECSDVWNLKAAVLRIEVCWLAASTLAIFAGIFIKFRICWSYHVAAAKQSCQIHLPVQHAHLLL